MNINGNRQYVTSYQYNENADSVSKNRKNADGEQKSFLQQMQEHMAQMRENIKNGTIQPTFQTGGQSYTKEEWEKLLEKFDEAEETIRAEIEAETEAKIEAEAESEMEKEIVAESEAVKEKEQETEQKQETMQNNSQRA